VEHFSSPTSRVKRGRKSNKLPWKKISDWMIGQGASYPFAPATCARKWDDIVRKAAK
jgi:hypothetical protein